MDYIYRLPLTSEEAFVIYKLACRINNKELSDATKKQAAYFEPFVKNPFDYAECLGRAGALELVGGQILPGIRLIRYSTL